MPITGSTVDFNPAALGPFDSTNRFNDRPDMTVDSNDDVYVVRIKDVGVLQPFSVIYFAKSPSPGPPGPGNPTGLDFTGLGDAAGAPITVNDFPNCFDQANAPDGTVYVAWIDVNVTNPNPKPETLKLDHSLVGVGIWGLDITVANISALGSTVTTAGGATDARAQSYPVIAVFLGWLVLGEPISSQMLAAAVIIFLALILITVQRPKKAAAKKGNYGHKPSPTLSPQLAAAAPKSDALALRYANLEKADSFGTGE